MHWISLIVIGDLSVFGEPPQTACLPEENESHSIYAQSNPERKEEDQPSD